LQKKKKKKKKKKCSFGFFFPTKTTKKITGLRSALTHLPPPAAPVPTDSEAECISRSMSSAVWRTCSRRAASSIAAVPRGSPRTGDGGRRPAERALAMREAIRARVRPSIAPSQVLVAAGGGGASLSAAVARPSLSSAPFTAPPPLFKDSKSASMSHSPS
jgi:hypothetical protein